MKDFDYTNLQKTDPAIFELLQKEIARQESTLEMIPSESITPLPVLETLGSVLVNKYSEGYVGKRYYGGNQFIDEIETLAIERAKKLFDVEHANVQAYSGSPANMAVYLATCAPGETVLGLSLPDGGHLTHGWKASATSQFFKAVQYHVKDDGFIDLDEVRELAKTHQPKLIWVGATAYVREFPFEEFAKIAAEVGAYLAADISHIAGLVVAGAHKSPADFADIITTTTHKTLGGPRGALIMVTKKGLKKDPELAGKIDKAVFPGLQGGPHNNQTAAIAVALNIADSPEFKAQAKQIVANAKALAEELTKLGIKLVTGGTDNHMILIDAGVGKGIFAGVALEAAGIIVNKNTIPRDPSSPFYPSGIRLGTPILTARKMKEPQMQQIAKWISEILGEVKDCQLPDTKEARLAYIKNFKNSLGENSKIKEIKIQVSELAKQFPIYA